MKVWDIVAPKDNWGRYYAILESKRIKWFNLWNYAKQVEVKYL